MKVVWAGYETCFEAVRKRRAIDLQAHTDLELHVYWKMYLQTECALVSRGFKSAVDYQHSSHVSLYVVGLHGKNGETNSWPMRTFGTILKRFQHENVSANDVFDSRTGFFAHN